jgi:predicted MFS family arabinose efflux permease
MVLLALGVGGLAAYQQFKLPPVLPLLLKQYGYDRTIAGGYMAIYAAVGLALSALIGVVIERQGVRRALVVSMLCFLLGSGLTMLVPELQGVVLTARGIEGVGFTIVAVVAPVLATSAALPRHVPIAIAIFAAWIPLGQLSAAILAVPIVGAGLWQPLWWIGIGLTLAFGAIAWRKTGRVGSRVATRGRLSLSRLQWGGLILNAAIFTLWSTEIFAFFTWFPQYLVEQRGLSLAESQVPYALPVLAILVFSIASGYLLRAGIAFTTLIGLGLVFQAAVWFAIPWLDKPAVGLLAVGLFGFGAGITPTGLFAGPTVMLGQANARSTAYGVIMSGRNVGVLLGPILLPPVHDWLESWDKTGLVFGGITAFGALGTVALKLVADRIRAAETAAAQTTSR